MNTWPPAAHASLRCHGADEVLIGRITRSVLADAGLQVDRIEAAVAEVRVVCASPAWRDRAISCSFFERPDAVRLDLAWLDGGDADCSERRVQFVWDAGSSKC